jgi:hypothetical protein
VRITCTTKDTKVTVARDTTKQTRKWRIPIEHRSGHTIKQINSSKDSFTPIRVQMKREEVI